MKTLSFPHRQKFVDELKLRMEIDGLTVDDIVQITGKSMRTVKTWFSGSPPETPTIRKIQEALANRKPKEAVQPKLPFDSERRDWAKDFLRALIARTNDESPTLLVENAVWYADELIRVLDKTA